MIKGNLVGLRGVEVSDLENLKEWRNLAHFRKNFREVREINSYQQNKWFETVSSSANDYMFAIVRLQDMKIIGACGLLYINWIIGSADFSFYIGEEESYIDNKGYADEATKLLIDYGFGNLNLNKIWMELYEFDKTKMDFFTTKFKFKQDGRLRENCFENGKYWDSFIISLLKKDMI